MGGGVLRDHNCTVLMVTDQSCYISEEEQFVLLIASTPKG